MDAHQYLENKKIPFYCSRCTRPIVDHYPEFVRNMIPQLTTLSNNRANTRTVSHFLGAIAASITKEDLPTLWDLRRYLQHRRISFIPETLLDAVAGKMDQKQAAVAAFLLLLTTSLHEKSGREACISFTKHLGDLGLVASHDLALEILRLLAAELGTIVQPSITRPPKNLLQIYIGFLTCLRLCGKYPTDPSAAAETLFASLMNSAAPDVLWTQAVSENSNLEGYLHFIAHALEHFHQIARSSGAQVARLPSFADYVLRAFETVEPICYTKEPLVGVLARGTVTEQLLRVVMGRLNEMFDMILANQSSNYPSLVQPALDRLFDTFLVSHHRRNVGWIAELTRGGLIKLGAKLHATRKLSDRNSLTTLLGLRVVRLDPEAASKVYDWIARGGLFRGFSLERTLELFKFIFDASRPDFVALSNDDFTMHSPMLIQVIESGQLIDGQQLGLKIERLFLLPEVTFPSRHLSILSAPSRHLSVLSALWLQWLEAILNAQEVQVLAGLCEALAVQLKQSSSSTSVGFVSQSITALVRNPLSGSSNSSADSIRSICTLAEVRQHHPTSFFILLDCLFHACHKKKLLDCMAPDHFLRTTYEEFECLVLEQRQFHNAELLKFHNFGNEFAQRFEAQMNSDEGIVLSKMSEFRTNMELFAHRIPNIDVMEGHLDHVSSMMKGCDHLLEKARSISDWIASVPKKRAVTGFSEVQDLFDRHVAQPPATTSKLTAFTALLKAKLFEVFSSDAELESFYSRTVIHADRPSCFVNMFVSRELEKDPSIKTALVEARRLIMSFLASGSTTNLSQITNMKEFDPENEERLLQPFFAGSATPLSDHLQKHMRMHVIHTHGRHISNALILLGACGPHDIICQQLLDEAFEEEEDDHGTLAQMRDRFRKTRELAIVVAVTEAPALCKFIIERFAVSDARSRDQSKHDSDAFGVELRELVDKFVAEGADDLGPSLVWQLHEMFPLLHDVLVIGRCNVAAAGDDTAARRGRFIDIICDAATKFVAAGKDNLAGDKEGNATKGQLPTGGELRRSMNDLNENLQLLIDTITNRGSVSETARLRKQVVEIVNFGGQAVYRVQGCVETGFSRSIALLATPPCGEGTAATREKVLVSSEEIDRLFQQIPLVFQKSERRSKQADIRADFEKADLLQRIDAAAKVFVQTHEKLMEKGFPLATARNGFSHQWPIVPQLDALYQSVESAQTALSNWDNELNDAYKVDYPKGLLLLVPHSLLTAALPQSNDSASWHTKLPRQLLQLFGEEPNFSAPLTAGGVGTLSGVAEQLLTQSEFLRATFGNLSVAPQGPCNTEVLRYSAATHGAPDAASPASFAEMMATVLERYVVLKKRKPYWFEIFYCSPSTTEFAVELFAKQMTAFPSAIFTIIGAHLLTKEARNALCSFLEGARKKPNLLICAEGLALEFLSIQSVSERFRRNAAAQEQLVTATSDALKTFDKQLPVTFVVGDHCHGKTHDIEHRIAAAKEQVPAPRVVRIDLVDSDAAEDTLLRGLFPKPTEGAAAAQQRGGIEDPLLVYLNVSAYALGVPCGGNSNNGMEDVEEGEEEKGGRGTTMDKGKETRCVIHRMLLQLMLRGVLIDRFGRLHFLPPSTTLLVEVSTALMATGALCTLDSVLPFTSALAAAVVDVTKDPLNAENDFLHHFDINHLKRSLQRGRDLVPRNVAQLVAFFLQMSSSEAELLKMSNAMNGSVFSLADDGVPLPRSFEQCKALIRSRVLRNSDGTPRVVVKNYVHLTALLQMLLQRLLICFSDIIRLSNSAVTNAAFRKDVVNIFVPRLIEEAILWSTPGLVVNVTSIAPSNPAAQCVYLPHRKKQIIATWPKNRTPVPESLRKYESLDPVYHEGKPDILALKNSHPDSEEARIFTVGQVVDGNSSSIRNVKKILWDDLHFILLESTMYKLLFTLEHLCCSRQGLVILGHTGAGKTFLLNALDLMLKPDGIFDKFKEDGRMIEVFFASSATESVQRRTAALARGGAGPKALEDAVKAEILSALTACPDAVAQLKFVGDALQTLQAKFPLLDLSEATASFSSIKEEATRGVMSSETLLSKLTDVVAVKMHQEKLVSRLKRRIIRPGLTEDDMRRFLHEEVLPLARFLNGPVQGRFEDEQRVVIVFFDELNTSSIPGFFKTLFIDRRIPKGIADDDGNQDDDDDKIPDNVFFVGAINPFDEFGTYAVTPLHKSLAPLVKEFDDLGATDLAALGGAGADPAAAAAAVGLSELHQYIMRALSDTNEQAIKDDVLKRSLAILIEKAHGNSLRFSENAKRAQRERRLEQLREAANGVRTALRKRKQHGYHRSGAGPVSQRDIRRVLEVLKTTLKLFGLRNKSDTAANATAALSTSDVLSAVVVAVYMCYVCRLDGTDRTEIEVMLTEEIAASVERLLQNNAAMLESEKAFLRSFTSLEKVVRSSIASVVNLTNFDLEDGIALTDTLAENIFAVLLSACSDEKKRLSVAIIGQPGVGKTLAVRIVQRNMKGTYSSTSFFKKIQQHLHVIFLQGAKTTTAEQIADLFKQARVKQKLSPGSVVLVCFDEAGLPANDMKVMKAVHEPLDSGEIAFVCLSNRDFDAANQNRMMTIRRDACTEEDLIHLARGCLGLQVALPSGMIHYEPTPNDLVAEGLGKAYFEIIRRAKEAKQRSDDRGDDLVADSLYSRFTNREFIHLLRYIQLVCRPKSNPITLRALVHGIEYNAPGCTADEIDELCVLFTQHIIQTSPRADEWKQYSREKWLRTPAKVLEDSYARPVPAERFLRPRYKMLVDPTEDYSRANQVLDKLLHRERLAAEASTPKKGATPGVPPPTAAGVEKIFLSDLSGDASDIIAKLRLLMERGTHVVIFNPERIMGSLFDLLNMNFSEKRSRDASGNSLTQYMAMLAIGARTHPCIVHDNFRITFVVRQQVIMSLRRSAPALLSRQEIHVLQNEELFDAAEEETVGAAAKLLVARSQLFVDAVGEYGFTSAVRGQTVQSAAMLHLRKRKVSVVDASDVTAVNRTLMSVAIPRAVLSACSQDHPRVERRTEYLRAYFNDQAHFGLQSAIDHYTAKAEQESGRNSLLMLFLTPDVAGVRRLMQLSGEEAENSGLSIVAAESFTHVAQFDAFLCRQCTGDGGAKDLTVVVTIDRRAQDLEFVNHIRHRALTAIAAVASSNSSASFTLDEYADGDGEPADVSQVVVGGLGKRLRIVLLVTIPTVMPATFSDSYVLSYLDCINADEGMLTLMRRAAGSEQSSPLVADSEGIARPAAALPGHLTANGLISHFVHTKASQIQLAQGPESPLILSRRGGDFYRRGADASRRIELLETALSNNSALAALLTKALVKGVSRRALKTALLRASGRGGEQSASIAMPFLAAFERNVNDSVCRTGLGILSFMTSDFALVKLLSNNNSCSSQEEAVDEGDVKRKTLFSKLLPKLVQAYLAIGIEDCSSSSTTSGGGDQIVFSTPPEFELNPWLLCIVVTVTRDVRPLSSSGTFNLVAEFSRALRSKRCVRELFDLWQEEQEDIEPSSQRVWIEAFAKEALAQLLPVPFASRKAILDAIVTDAMSSARRNVTDRVASILAFARYPLRHEMLRNLHRVTLGNMLRADDQDPEPAHASASVVLQHIADYVLVKSKETEDAAEEVLHVLEEATHAVLWMTHSKAAMTQLRADHQSQCEILCRLVFLETVFTVIKNVGGDDEEKKVACLELARSTLSESSIGKTLHHVAEDLPCRFLVPQQHNGRARFLSTIFNGSEAADQLVKEVSTLIVLWYAEAFTIQTAHVSSLQKMTRASPGSMAFVMRKFFQDQQAKQRQQHGMSVAEARSAALQLLHTHFVAAELRKSECFSSPHTTPCADPFPEAIYIFLREHFTSIFNEECESVKAVGEKSVQLICMPDVVELQGSHSSRGDAVGGSQQDLLGARENNFFKIEIVASRALLKIIYEAAGREAAVQRLVQMLVESPAPVVPMAEPNIHLAFLLSDESPEWLSFMVSTAATSPQKLFNPDEVRSRIAAGLGAAAERLPLPVEREHPLRPRDLPCSVAAELLAPPFGRREALNLVRHLGPLIESLGVAPQHLPSRLSAEAAASRQLQDLESRGQLWADAAVRNVNSAIRDLKALSPSTTIQEVNGLTATVAELLGGGTMNHRGLILDLLQHVLDELAGLRSLWEELLTRGSNVADIAATASHLAQKSSASFGLDVPIVPQQVPRFRNTGMTNPDFCTPLLTLATLSRHLCDEEPKLLLIHLHTVLFSFLTQTDVVLLREMCLMPYEYAPARPPADADGDASLPAAGDANANAWRELDSEHDQGWRAVLAQLVESRVAFPIDLLQEVRQALGQVERRVLDTMPDSLNRTVADLLEDFAEDPALQDFASAIHDGCPELGNLRAAQLWRLSHAIAERCQDYVFSLGAQLIDRRECCIRAPAAMMDELRKSGTLHILAREGGGADGGGIPNNNEQRRAGLVQLIGGLQRFSDLLIATARCDGSSPSSLIGHLVQLLPSDADRMTIGTLQFSGLQMRHSADVFSVLAHLRNSAIDEMESLPSDPDLIYTEMVRSTTDPRSGDIAGNDDDDDDDDPSTDDHENSSLGGTLPSLTEGGNGGQAGSDVDGGVRGNNPGGEMPIETVAAPQPTMPFERRLRRTIDKIVSNFRRRSHSEGGVSISQVSFDEICRYHSGLAYHETVGLFQLIVEKKSDPGAKARGFTIIWLDLYNWNTRPDAKCQFNLKKIDFTAEQLITTLKKSSKNGRVPLATDEFGFVLGYNEDYPISSAAQIEHLFMQFFESIEKREEHVATVEVTFPEGEKRLIPALTTARVIDVCCSLRRRHAHSGGDARFGLDEEEELLLKFLNENEMTLMVPPETPWKDLKSKRLQLVVVRTYELAGYLARVGEVTVLLPPNATLAHVAREFVDGDRFACPCDENCTTALSEMCAASADKSIYLTSEDLQHRTGLLLALRDNSRTAQSALIARRNYLTVHSDGAIYERWRMTFRTDASRGQPRVVWLSVPFSPTLPTVEEMRSNVLRSALCTTLFPVDGSEEEERSWQLTVIDDRYAKILGPKEHVDHHMRLCFVTCCNFAGRSLVAPNFLGEGKSVRFATYATVRQAAAYGRAKSVQQASLIWNGVAIDKTVRSKSSLLEHFADIGFDSDDGMSRCVDVRLKNTPHPLPYHLVPSVSSGEMPKPFSLFCSSSCFAEATESLQTVLRALEADSENDDPKVLLSSPNSDDDIIWVGDDTKFRGLDPTERSDALRKVFFARVPITSTAAEAWQFDVVIQDDPSVQVPASNTNAAAVVHPLHDQALGTAAILVSVDYKQWPQRQFPVHLHFAFASSFYILGVPESLEPEAFCREDIFQVAMRCLRLTKYSPAVSCHVKSDADGDMEPFEYDDSYNEFVGNQFELFVESSAADPRWNLLPCRSLPPRDATTTNAAATAAPTRGILDDDDD